MICRSAPVHTKTVKLANKYFSLEIYRVADEIKENTDGSKFYIYLLIEGRATVNFFNGETSVKSGRSDIYTGVHGKVYDERQF